MSSKKQLVKFTMAISTIRFLPQAIVIDYSGWKLFCVHISEIFICFYKDFQRWKTFFFADMNFLGHERISILQLLWPKFSSCTNSINVDTTSFRAFVRRNDACKLNTQSISLPRETKWFSARDEKLFKWRMMKIMFKEFDSIFCYAEIVSSLGKYFRL